MGSLEMRVEIQHATTALARPPSQEQGQWSPPRPVTDRQFGRPDNIGRRRPNETKSGTAAVREPRDPSADSCTEPALTSGAGSGVRRPPRR
jgi:hypothetical protein